MCAFGPNAPSGRACLAASLGIDLKSMQPWRNTKWDSAFAGVGLEHPITAERFADGVEQRQLLGGASRCLPLKDRKPYRTPETGKLQRRSLSARDI